MIYQPNVKRFSRTPQVLSSPTGKEAFDVIEVCDKIGLDYRKTVAGYSATVTIPQIIVGLALQPGSQLTLECIYGNATGTAVSAGSYWTDNSFCRRVTYDIPSESRLQQQ